MKEPISIKEILAVVIKRGKLIMCVALVIAIAAGAAKFAMEFSASRNPQNTQEEIDARNQVLMEEYKAELNRLKENVANAARMVLLQREYNESSVLMSIDPYSKYRSDIVLAITGVDETEFAPVYQQNGTFVEYAVYQIQQQYMSCWDGLDMEVELQEGQYAGVEEKYLRELISVTADGGMLTITAISGDEETAEELSEMVYECIQEIQSVIVNATFEHTLSFIGQASKVEIDTELLELQKDNQDKLTTYVNTLKKQETALNKLEKPAYEAVYTVSDIAKSVFVWIVLGGIVGFLMACICVWMKYILNDSLETSRQMESALAVPYLGNAEKSGSIWNRVASRFVGERIWNDQSQALEYIVENIRSRVSCQKCIAMVSTLAIAENDSELRQLLSAIRELGYNVNFVNQAEANPAAIASIRNADYVILVERLSVSNRKSIRFVMEQAGQFETAILGFITA